MQTKWATIVCAGVMLGLLLAGEAAADRRSIAGSVSITGPGDTELVDGDLVGLAVIANPGFEKTITQQLLPPFTLPVFIEEDLVEDDAASPSSRSGLRLLRRHLDTTLVLTNPKGGTSLTDDLHLTLTLWNAAGDEALGSRSVTLAPHQTMLVPVSSLLVP